MAKLCITIFFCLFLTTSISPEVEAYPTAHDELDYIGAFGLGPIFSVDNSGVKSISHGPRDLKKVALTFDDGPFAVTNDLLDILAANNVKATFFLVGQQVRKFPKIAMRETSEGHQIGNHTDKHGYLTKLSEMDWKSQIDTGFDAICDATGVEVELFRPPYRAYNPEILDYCNDAGMTLVFWDVDSRDWETKSPDLVKQRVLANVKSGSIIELHDFSTGTKGALNSIIQTLKSRGYQFVTVGEMVDDLALQAEQNSAGENQ